MDFHERIVGTQALEYVVHMCSEFGPGASVCTTGLAKNEVAVKVAEPICRSDLDSF
jgi:hypothetical protein